MGGGFCKHGGLVVQEYKNFSVAAKDEHLKEQSQPGQDRQTRRFAPTKEMGQD